MSKTGIRGAIQALVLTGALLETGVSHAEAGKKLYKQGMAAEQGGDLDAAYTDYQAALKLAPTDIAYRLASERARQAAAAAHVHKGELLVQDERLKDAMVEFLRALAIDPANQLAGQDLQIANSRMDKADRSEVEAPNAEDVDRPAPPVHLDAISTMPVTLHATEQSSVLYQTIGRIAGLNVLIDPDYVSKRVTIDLKEATMAEALQILGDLSNSFYKPSTHNTIYVASDTRPKRTQLEQLAVRTFYLSNVGQQADANDILTTLRNVLPPTVKLFLVQSQNAVVIRGTADEILLARNLIASLDAPKPEVLVDVYVMEVRKDKLRDIGLSPPTSVAVTSSSSATLNEIGRSSSYSYSIGQAALELLLTDSETQVLQNPRVRAIDGQKAVLNIGSKIPTATGSYTTATSSTTSSVQTQFQYIDVGVKVELTPTIHANRDVTMKLVVEISSESGTDTIDDVAEPVISQEKAEEVIRLKDGEVTVMAGLLQKEKTRTVSGTPGLGEVPLMKYLFSTQQNETVDDELVFMLVPHVVRAPEVSRGTAVEIDTGASDAVRIHRIAPTKAPAAVPGKDSQEK